MITIFIFAGIVLVILLLRRLSILRDRERRSLDKVLEEMRDD